MKHTEEVVVPARTETRVKLITCDLCKKEIENEHYHVDEVVVHHKVGNAFPESGRGTETSVDVCGSCFNEKLLPWLISLGALPTTVRWEY